MWRKPLLAGLASLALTAGLFSAGAGTASAAETPPPAPPATTSVADTDITPANAQFLAAVSTGSFRAGDIITDGNMYNGDAMSADDVQAFLDANAQPCGNCIDVKSFSGTAKPQTAECDPVAGGTMNAATIIATVGKACDVSQRALLTLIQKESGLIESASPSDADYQTATGYECPDTGAGCDPASATFFDQVYGAARQLQNDRTSPRFPVGTPTNIAFSPDSTCGTGAVTIATHATAALYSYTPYVSYTEGDDTLSGAPNHSGCGSDGNQLFWVIYTDWFGYPQIDVDRVSGADRYSGAVEIAKKAFPTTAPVVFVANGQNYPDALSAGPAAVKLGGPLLLTDPAALSQPVIDEISALKPGRIVVVGGVNSVSDAVKAQLATLVSGVTVDRIAGASRYDTSRLLVQDAFKGGADGAFIATGANFPDALSAGAAAGSKGQPVLLVDGSASALDSGSVQVLKGLGVDTLTVVGGPNSVSTGVLASAQQQVAPSTRISGTDRYDTSQKINATVFKEASRAFLATGVNFPDALAGSAWAGRVDAPLYVVQPNCVPAAVRTGFRPAGVHQVTLLGGPNSLGTGVLTLQGC